MSKASFYLSVVSVAVSSALMAEEQITIEVVASPIPEAVTTETLTSDDVAGPHADGGDFLKDLPGVSGIRLGGHAIDPVIRGQSQNRLNVLLDGAYIHGGCPNRMDPPTSYASLESYDKVTVIKGNQTVIYGGGGSGGTVLFERETERFSEEENLRGTAGAGYESNGSAKEIFADVAAGSSRGYVRTVLEAKEADNYEDGDGNEVRSAYTERSGSLSLGYTPDNNTLAEISVDASRADDVYFFGSMDTPETDSDTVRFKFSKKGMYDSLFSAFKFEAYQTDVYHLMDNYSLEGRPAPMMQMETEADSLTRGGRLSGEIDTGETQWTVGFDYQHNNRDAILSSYMMMTWQEAGFVWPDVDIMQSGVFVEASTDLSDKASLSAGVRYDRVEAEANKADEEPEAMGIQSPNALYTDKYGVIAEKHTEDNVGGFIRYERDFDLVGGSWFANLSRSVRTADATERYMARKAPTAMMDWVGNPELDPEVHHQLELGATKGEDDWRLTSSIYYNRVSDFILKQTGMTGTLYSNVDAELYGAELEASTSLNANWSTSLTAAYVRGVNLDDNKALPQIPALEATLGLEYRRENWMVGSKLRAVDEQTHTDIAGGDVVDVSPGYGVLDLYASVDLSKNASLKLGIDNVMDRTYTEHLTREDAFTGLNVAANEPGRSLWLKASVDF